MSRLRIAALAVTLPAVLLGCTGNDESPRPAAPSGPTCVSDSVSGSELHLEVPAGFTEDADGTPAALLRHVWVRESDTDHDEVVTLSAFDPDRYQQPRTDADLLLRAAALTTRGMDSGRPEAERAARRVRERGLTEVSYTVSSGQDAHSVFAAVRSVGEDRFTITLVAPPGDGFESLGDEVWPTVAEGPCP